MAFSYRVLEKYKVVSETLPEVLQGKFDASNIQIFDVLSALDTCRGSLTRSSGHTSFVELLESKLEQLRQLGAPGSPKPESSSWMFGDSPLLSAIAAKNWRAIVHPSAATEKDPEQLLEGLTFHRRHPRGYLRTVPLDLKKLSESLYNYSGEDQIFEDWRKGKLSPPITIKGKLWDGAHRCCFAYWLDVKVPVVELNLEKNEDR